MELFLEAAGKRGSILEPAGKGDFCNRVFCGAQHFHSNPETVPEEVLFGRKVLLFHKNPVKVGTVNAGIPGNVRNPDGIGVVVLQIFLCFFEVTLSWFSETSLTGVCMKEKSCKSSPQEARDCPWAVRKVSRSCSMQPAREGSVSGCGFWKIQDTENTVLERISGTACPSKPTQA